MTLYIHCTITKSDDIIYSVSNIMSNIKPHNLKFIKENEVEKTLRESKSPPPPFHFFGLSNKFVSMHVSGQESTSNHVGFALLGILLHPEVEQK